MKHIKPYSSRNIFGDKQNKELEIGDYVLLGDNRIVRYADEIIDNITNFVSTHIGQYIKLLKKEQEDVMFDWIYVIQYDNVPEELKDYFLSENGFETCKRTNRENIIHFSKNKEDLEPYINSKKYNL